MADIKTTSEITDETSANYNYAKSEVTCINESLDQTTSTHPDGEAIIYLKQKIDELITEVNILKNQ